MTPTARRTFSRRRLVGAGAAGLAAAALAPLWPRAAGATFLSGVTGTVNIDGLNVRRGPSTGYAAVNQLPYGSTVSCLETSGQWFRIAAGSIGGWVYSPYITLTPTTQINTYWRGRTDIAIAALTFDCGDDAGYTSQILDTLANRGVRSSFGVTGKWVAANPDLARRIRDEGHHFVNHTLSHHSMTGYSNSYLAATTPAERLAEVVGAEEQIWNATGRNGRPWFRPPYGDYDASVLRDISANGFAYNALWTVDSLGWKGISVGNIVANCLNQTGNGYIYLMHVGSASQDGVALPQVIDGLVSRGFVLGTLPQVLGLEAPPSGGPPPPPGTAFPVGSTVVTTADQLWLRSGPGTGYAVLASMAVGTRLTITGAPQDANGFTWYPVNGPYGSGWCAGKFLSAA